MAAEVCEHARAQGEDAALRVERERGSEVLVAAHVCGEKVLAAIGAPAAPGGASFRAAYAISASSGMRPVFMPKPPPISPTTTRK